MVKIWKVNILLCNVFTLYLCTLFLLQGGKWTEYGLSRSVFVTFASSKRGLTCLPARETTYTNTGYAATTILIRKVHILTREFS